VIWHRHDAGIDHGITLVSEEYDAKNKSFPSLHEPEVRALMEAVAALRAGMETLLDTIASGANLDAGAVVRIRSAGHKAASSDLYRFREVDDIAEHWFHDDAPEIDVSDYRMEQL